ncbi:MAG: Gldg family protein [Pseudomonadota bacterium]
MARASAQRRLTYARLALPLVVLLFLAAVVLADRGLSHLRLDLSQDKVFTISPVTAELLAGLEEPLQLRLYTSSLLTDVTPAYASHAARVTALLREMERLAGPNLNVEVLDPEPFSPAEDQALTDGLTGLTTGDGTQIYFGLAGRNLVDQTQTIAFLDPERAASLEYDLTALIAALANPRQPRVGLFSRLPLNGNPLLRQPRQAILDILAQQMDLQEVDLETGRVPQEISVLMAVQPIGLTPAEAYALDQFVLRGGRLLLFLDPYSEQQALMNAQRGLPLQPADFSSIEPLLAAWGAELPGRVLATDVNSARRVMVGSGDRQTVTDYVVWLSIPEARMRAGDPLVAGLGSLNLNSAGFLLPRDGEGAPLEPLVWTSPEAQVLPLDRLALSPDPTQLLADYQPGGQALTLAARLNGTAESAFPAGPPSELARGETGDALAQEHRAASGSPIAVVAVADSDLLYNSTWIGQGQVGGQPLAGNGAFVLTALEEMLGQPSLASLRGRGQRERPFMLLEEMARSAEQDLRRQEAALTASIERAQSEIGEIEQTQDGGIVLSDAQRESLAALRGQLLSARAELRQVQRGLREEVDDLVREIQLVNILAVPALVALLGLAVVLLRRRRALRQPAER